MKDQLGVNEIYDIVIDKLQTKTPWLLLREGDGEAMVISQRKIDYVCNRQFGYLPEQKDLDYISKIVADAYTYADVIGIPTQHHIDCCGSYWAKAYSYLVELRPQVSDIPTCSIDIHSELLHSGLLDQILYQQKDLVYISGRKLDDGFRRKYKIQNIQSFHVPAEQKFESDKSQSHYPKKYGECLNWIENTDVYGKLCLVASGVLGKWYAAMLKQNGGIVLDIGSVADAWAGKVTRGAGRGADAEDLTYKL